MLSPAHQGPKCPCWVQALTAKGSCHWCGTLSSMTHCHSSSGDAESCKARNQTSALTLWPVFAYPSELMTSFLLPPTSFLHSMVAVPSGADLCLHIRVLSLFLSTGATIHAQSPTLCCCIWLPSRDFNYFFGTQCETFLSV